jgi:hypothetical protein
LFLIDLVVAVILYYTKLLYRYYSGTAHPGEYVILRREPRNPYDSNAVRVDNMHGEKVGHIKREQAAVIAPLMDNPRLAPLLKFEGTIPRSGNAFHLPVTLDFYSVAPSAAQAPAMSTRLAAMVQQAMKRRPMSEFTIAPAFRQATPVAAAVAAKAAAPPPPVVQNKMLNWQAQAQELDDMFEKQSSSQLLGLIEIPMPTQFVNVKLFDYQQIGIRWLVHQETSNKAAPFFKQVNEKGKLVGTHKCRMHNIICNDLGCAVRVCEWFLFLTYSAPHAFVFFSFCGTVTGVVVRNYAVLSAGTTHTHQGRHFSR